MAKRGQAISKKYAALLLALVLLLASAIGGALWIILSENKISSSKYDKQELFFDFSASAIFYGEQFAGKSGNNQSISGVIAYRKEKEIVGGETKEVYIPFTNLSDIGEVSFNVPQTTQHTATGEYTDLPSLGKYGDTENNYANPNTLLATDPKFPKIKVTLSGEAAGLYSVPIDGFPVPMKAVVYQGSIKDASVYYTRIEDALNAGATNETIATSQKFYVLPSLKTGNKLYTPAIYDDCVIGAQDQLILKTGSAKEESNVEYGNVSGYTHRSEEYRTASNYKRQIFADAQPENYLKTNVILKNGKRLTVQGGASLIIGGITGATGTGVQGHTSSDYAQLTLEEDAVVDVNSNAILDCLGFIKEDYGNTTPGEAQLKVGNGSQIINSGTVYSPFVVYDYRGGKSTAGSYLNDELNIGNLIGVMINGYKKEGEIVPFSIFDMPNIQANIQTNYNASLIGYADLYTGGMPLDIGGALAELAEAITKARHNLTNVSVIGNSNSIINLKAGSYVTTKFKPYSAEKTFRDVKQGEVTDDARPEYEYKSLPLETIPDVQESEYFPAGRTENGETTINIYGGATLGLLQLTLQLGIKITVTSSKAFFPISWKYDIILNDIDDNPSNENSVSEINVNAKFMSGSRLTVNQGATLNISAKGTSDNPGGVIFYPASAEYKESNYATPDEYNKEHGNEKFIDKTPHDRNDKYYKAFAEPVGGDAAPGVRYPSKSAAELIVKGTVNVTGKFGGAVQPAASTAVFKADAASYDDVISDDGYGAFKIEKGEGLSGVFETTATGTFIKSDTQIQSMQLSALYGSNNSFKVAADGEYYGAYIDGGYVWLPAFNVTLNANGGTFSDGATTKIIEAKAGVTVSDQEKPTREHYHFTHWCTNASCENDANCADRKEGVLYADSTLYAIWEENEYTLYRQDVVDGVINGDPVVIATFTIINPIELEWHPTLDNYTFNYWRVGASEDSAIIQSVNMAEYLNKAFANGGEEGSVTIYAHWVEAAVYTIDFNTTIDNADQDYSHANVSVVDRADVTYNAPTASTSGKGYGSQDNDITYQYAWGGWYIDEELTKPYESWEQLRDEVKSDGEETLVRTLYAKWIKKHTVIIDINAGASDNAAPEAENATVYLVDGQSYTLPAGLESKNQILTVTHYFAGWQLSDQSLGQLSGEAGVSSLSLKATGDITVTAVWKLKHELSFVMGDSMIDIEKIWLEPGQRIIISGSEFDASAKSRDGDLDTSKYFGSWSIGGNGTLDGDSITADSAENGKITLTASWLDKFILTIVSNKDSAGNVNVNIDWENETKYLRAEDSYTLPVLSGNNEHTEKDTYFVRWDYGDAVSYNEGVVSITDNAEIKAVWQKKYVLKFVTEKDDFTIPEIYLMPNQSHNLTEQTNLAKQFDTNTSEQYYFGGWSNNGTPVSGSVTITQDTTLTVVWETKATINLTIKYEQTTGVFMQSGTSSRYEIQIDAGSGPITVTPETTITEDFSVPTFYVKQGHKLIVKTTKEDGKLTNTDITEVVGNVVNKECTAYCRSAGSCIVEGALVSLADGTQKAVEDLTYADRVLVFNHETGKMEAGYIAMLDHLEVEREWSNVINLEFSDGSILRIVWNHGLYNLTLNKYVFINEGNYGEYVGDSFYSAVYENGAFVGKSVTLVKSYITHEFIKVYNPTTVTHVNYFASNILNATALIGDILDCWHVNIFDYDSDMKYDEAKKQADIEKYGLYTYEDFKEYLTYEQFNALPFNYFKVAVGKGRTTWEEIIEIIKYINEGQILNPSGEEETEDEETPTE